MKFFKKFLSIITLSVLALTLCFSLGACQKPAGNEEWDGKTFVFYVYQEDGETPVQDAILSVCYNTSDSTASCSVPARTDASGKVEITITVDFVGTPCVHFNENRLPEGYGLPGNSSVITLNDGSVYEHAWSLTQKENVFNLTKLA